MLIRVFCVLSFRDSSHIELRLLYFEKLRFHTQWQHYPRKQYSGIVDCVGSRLAFCWMAICWKEGSFRFDETLPGNVRNNKRKPSWAFYES